MIDRNSIAHTSCHPHSHRGLQGTLLPGLLLLTLCTRLIAVNKPLLGNFATKNVVYAMIARNWAQGRATLWYPTLDCLCGTHRGLHMLEFPVSAYLSGWLWKTFGGVACRFGGV